MNINSIKRHIADKVELLLKHFPVVVIIGARQAGKTELAKKARPLWKYFDLERAQDFDFIASDPGFFFEQYPQHVIIDEAQEYPKLFRTLRSVIDANRGEKGRFILTGSSSPELMEKASESLAGRVAIVELGTLKASEYYQKPLSEFYNLFEQKLDKRHVVTGIPPLTNQQMQKVWFKGGYPEPLLSDDENFYFQWLENYQRTYINRDIAKLFPRLNKIAYRRFLTMLGQLSGTILNYSELARAIEVSETTIKEYLDIAQGTFLWRSLLSYENNVAKSIVKRPKGYLRDSSLVHYFLHLQNIDDLFTHPKVGHSFESFVIEEILKGLHVTTVTNWNYNYYRTRSGVEIDLILTGAFGTLPIEIKYGSTVLRRQLRSLTELIYSQQLPFGIIVNQSQETQWLTKDIVQLPVGWL